MTPGLDFSKLFPNEKVLTYEISDNKVRGYFVVENVLSVVTIHYMIAMASAPALGMPVSDPTYWNRDLTIRVPMLKKEYENLFSKGTATQSDDPSITGEIIARWTLDGKV